MVKGEVVDKIYLDWWGGCKKRPSRFCPEVDTLA